MTGTRTARIHDLARTVWSAGELDRLPHFLHPRVVVRNGDASVTCHGLAEVTAAVRTAREPFAEYRMTVLETVEQGDVVAWRWEVRAKLRSAAALNGSLGVLAADLEDLLWVGFGGMCFSTFTGDLVVDERSESNPLVLMRQLGVPAA